MTRRVNAMKAFIKPARTNIFPITLFRLRLIQSTHKPGQTTESLTIDFKFVFISHDACFFSSRCLANLGSSKRLG